MTQVVRGGQEKEVEAREIVPGDICVIEEGQTIPADGKVLADYDDKDRSKANDILQKKQNAKKAKESNKEKADDKDDEDDAKGPSVCSVDQSAITGTCDLGGLV